LRTAGRLEVICARLNRGCAGRHRPTARDPTALADCPTRAATGRVNLSARSPDATYRRVAGSTG
jgi:hypothetical protein